MGNSTNRDDGILYPRGLENAEINQRVDYFNEAMIKHYYFDQTISDANRYLQTRMRGTVIIIVGPAGVGKTALCELLCDQANASYFASHPDDQFVIPAVGIEALAPEREGEAFDWDEFKINLLERLQIPLVGESLPAVNQMILGKKVLVPQYDVGVKGIRRALRRRLISGIDVRNPTLVFVDEAANMLKGARGRSVDTQANTMRSLINNVKTKLLLTGAYDLHDLISSSGQLARRGRLIHMKAYTSKERDKFMGGLIGLKNSMPIKRNFDISDFADMLESGSAGCIGVVKSILLDVMVLSDMENARISRDLVSRCMPAADVVETLWREVFKGYYRVERTLHPDDKKGIGSARTQSEAKSETPSRRRRRGRVGLQKPRRHRMES
ncbi:ATP-binding protein [Paraburkholderia bannensis]|uniref:ATP-binding protein n=1 Tax=Paraburkholderia bannensis TaxID=765414 RepID=UPI002AC352BA|nr:AAA family ATPase [Paraburkholderia bannensis]